MFKNKGFWLKNTYFRIVAIVTVIVVISGIFYFGNIGSRPGISPQMAKAAEVTLEAADQDSLGISTETDFILTSDVALSPAAVRSCLTVEPGMEFDVKETSGENKQFCITPKTVLASNKIYGFRFNDDSWAFQTRSDFRIIRTLPRDKANGVPVNSGIEITFSHDNYKDLNEYFEITPKVEGFFERHKGTAVFAPKSLKPGTIYTVKIKKGLGVKGSDETLKQDYVFQFETQSPDAADNKRRSLEIYFNRNLYEYSSDEKPLVNFTYYRYENQKDDINVTVDLYQYSDVDHFISTLEKYFETPYWAVYARKTHREDVSNLSKIAAFKTPIQNVGYNNFILFPEELGKGFYLAETTFKHRITGEVSVHQVWLQISDASGYVSVSNNKTLVWVNSVPDGVPLPDTTVELKDGGILGKTGEDGTFVIDTPEGLADIEKDQNTYRFLKVISPEYGTCVIPLYKDGYFYYNRDPQYNYWKYVYFDRELYLPEDTINFWGLIKPREGIEAGKKLTIELEKSRTYGYYGSSAVITKKEIIMSEDYTFTGSLKLPNLSPGNYRILFKMDGEEITSKWFEVQTYTKPAYKIDIEQDKKAVFSGKDEISFNVKASFFEGTPVSSMELSYDSSSGSGKVITDEKGQARIAFVPVYNVRRGCNACEYFSVYNTLPEAGDIRGSANFMAFHNDMYLESSSLLTDKGAEIKVKLNEITLDRINNTDRQEETQNAYYSVSEYIGEPVAGHVIKGEILENCWEKEEAGQYYDFINKEVRTKYRYRHYTVHVSDFTVTTDDAGEGTFIFPSEEDKSYTIKLETVDGMERIITQEKYVYGSKIANYGWGYWDYYRLEEDKEKQKCYGVGEEYSLTFKNNTEVLPEGGKNRFLYLVGRNGLKDYEVKTSAHFSAMFEETDIPNLYVTGVYFNGRTYYQTSSHFIRFNNKERELDIAVTPDKESYRPGEEVTLNIKVMDFEGNTREAEVNISLVDEAMFMLMNQRVDTLNSLYASSLPSGIIADGYSHWCPDISDKPVAECGEGEGERKDFKDTAFFGTVRTDRKGNGQITFKVPDNLTSWRATYQCVTGDLWAGSGNIPIKVKLPFFVDMVLNENYLEGDAPEIAIRSFGTGITSGDDVEFTVSAQSLLEGEKVFTAKAFETVYVPLSELEEGKHSITIMGTVGSGLKDILTRDINVYKTYLEKERTDYYTLKKGMRIKGSKEGLTKLIFTDEGRGKYLSPLNNLYYTYGKRIDQRLAKLYSYNLLKEYFDADIEEPVDLNAHSYQTPDGGIAVVPYSDCEPELSAKIAALGPEIFDTNSLKDYFYKILFESGESDEEAGAALWGLAALNEPVLNQINSMLQLDEITVKTKLYLGLASWELGNGNDAGHIFREIVKSYGEVKKSYLIINSGSDRDDTLELTSLAAVLGMRVNAPESKDMYNYIRNNSTKDILVYLEKLMYLSAALERTDSEPVGFTYILDGERIEKKLKAGDTCQLLLHAKNLKKFKVVDVKGDVGITCIYDEIFKPDDLEETRDITISRQYLVNGKSTKEFDERDLIKVVIDCRFGNNALEGLYQVTDFLPSGLKIVAAPYSRGLRYSNIRYPYEISGQKISFYLYNSNYRNKRRERSPIVYYARVVSKGEFRAQGALVQDLKTGGEIKTTEEERIIIK